MNALEHCKVRLPFFYTPCILSLHKHVPGIQSPTGAHFFNELASLSTVISVTKRLTKKLNHNLLTFLALSESPIAIIEEPIPSKFQFYPWITEQSSGSLPCFSRSNISKVVMHKLR